MALCHDSVVRAERPDSVNDLLREWRNARESLWICPLDTLQLRDAVKRLSIAEYALHQFAMKLTDGSDGRR